MKPVPPALKGAWFDPSAPLVPDDTTSTDTDTIVTTAQAVDQKTGATGEPDQPVAVTVVTAVDGTITDAGSVNSTASATRRWASPESYSPTVYKRSSTNYEQVFAGTGTGPNDRDGSIQGTAYLTYTLVDNSTYNVDACLAFCDSVTTCGMFRL